MKDVGIREFRDHATAYLSGTEPIAVTKHGRVVGHYVPVGRAHPVKRDHAKVRGALDRLEETVNRVLAETGMTEDELADLFDVKKPLPE